MQVPMFSPCRNLLFSLAVNPGRRLDLLTLDGAQEAHSAAFPTLWVFVLACPSLIYRQAPSAVTLGPSEGMTPCIQRRGRKEIFKKIR